MPIGYRERLVAYCPERVLTSKVDGMSAFSTLAVLVSLAALWFLFAVQSVCVRCGGRGAHKHDCPFTRDER
jgi:hypothetical protein